jgi:glycosyltransferase 2 family protein
VKASGGQRDVIGSRYRWLSAIGRVPLARVWSRSTLPRKTASRNPMPLASSTHAISRTIVSRKHPRRSRMRMGWRPVLGLLLSAGFLVWTVRDVSPAAVSRALAQANLPLLIATAIVSTLIFPLRALRWRVILDPVAPRLPFGPLWRSTAIGMMVNNVAPARAGELARAFALTRERPDVAFSAAFASLAVDRAFDGIVVVLLLVVAMLDPAFPAETTIAGRSAASWAGGASAAIAVVVGVLYLVVFFPARLIGLYELLARRIAPRLEARGRAVLLAFVDGLGALRSLRRFLAVFAWTLAHWLVVAASFWIAFKALKIPVPLTAALFLQGLTALGAALPSSPGFFGIFEAFARTGLGVYGVAPALAVSWAIGYHVLSFIPITAFGAFYFVRLGMHFRDLHNGPASPAGEPKDATSVAAAMRA